MLSRWLNKAGGSAFVLAIAIAVPVVSAPAADRDAGGSRITNLNEAVGGGRHTCSATGCWHLASDDKSWRQQRGSVVGAGHAAPDIRQQRSDRAERRQRPDWGFPKLSREQHRHGADWQRLWAWYRYGHRQHQHGPAECTKRGWLAGHPEYNTGRPADARDRQRAGPVAREATQAGATPADTNGPWESCRFESA